MPSPDLPAELRAALDRKAEGHQRAKIAARAAAISQAYRGGGNSGLIRTEVDALAYALVRMPATYAAVAASLNALAEGEPDFAPQSLLDIGAGPSTATWAAAEAFPSLRQFTLLDANPSLRSLALDLARTSPRLSAMQFDLGDASRTIENAAAADLVIASYIVNELGEAERTALVEAMWAKTCGMLLVVEPGTPAGFGRIAAVRSRLIAMGAHTVAPCPHDKACPLVAPDWCHFPQRLQRSRTHRHLKGAELPFEDEKFSYAIVSRIPAAKRLDRVLAQPSVTKIAVTAKLCTASGVRMASAPHRDKAAYKRAKKWSWGDGLSDGVPD